MDRLTKNIEKAIKNALPNLAEHTTRHTEINSVRFEQRAAYLQHIKSVTEFVDAQIKSLRDLHAQVSGVHEEERARLTELVRGGQAAPPQQNWAVVATKKPAKVAPRAAARTAITLAPSIIVDAVRVANFAAVCSDSELYYVESCGHFAFMLGGQLFHGGMGSILSEQADQKRTIDCRFVKGCAVPHCNFYHDPTIFPHSNDVRNYHVGQFAYRPGARSARGFGSIDAAATDISTETIGGVSSARDRAVHELICAIVLTRHFNPGNI